MNNIIEWFYLFYNYFSNKNLEINNKIIGNWEKFIFFIIWKDNINNSLELIRWKNIYNVLIKNLIFKYKHDNVLKSIPDRTNYFYWKKDNTLIKKINKFKVIVINLECFYDYDNKKIYNLYYLNNLVRYCRINDYLMYLIGELHSDIVLNQIPKLKNYLSPYNNFSIKKEDNKNPSKSSINKILNTIIKDNEINKKELCYIGNNITSYYNFQLIFKHQYQQDHFQL